MRYSWLADTPVTLLKWGANPNHATAALHIKIGVKICQEWGGRVYGILNYH